MFGTDLISGISPKHPKTLKKTKISTDIGMMEEELNAIYNFLALFASAPLFM